MKKGKKIELDYDTIDRILTMAREEKRPFEAIKSEFGLGEKEVTKILKDKFSAEEYEMWKKKASIKKQPKPLRFQDDDFDDLDSKYYFKNKFD